MTGNPEASQLLKTGDFTQNAIVSDMAIFRQPQPLAFQT
jgi:hypothetical protein